MGVLWMLIPIFHITNCYVCTMSNCRLILTHKNKKPHLHTTSLTSNAYNMLCGHKQSQHIHTPKHTKRRCIYFYVIYLFAAIFFSLLFRAFGSSFLFLVNAFTFQFFLFVTFVWCFENSTARLCRQ